METTAQARCDLLYEGSIKALQGYRMIDTLKIENFRCFESVVLSDCRRVNIIVGRNSSGKTALLEAIELAASANPLSALQLKSQRGQEWSIGPDKASYDDFWRDLFCQFEVGKPISIEFTSSELLTRRLKILFMEVSWISGAYRDVPSELVTERVSIAFVYTDAEGKEYEIGVQSTRNGLQLMGADVPPINNFYFGAHGPFGTKDFAHYFSLLSKQNKHKKVIDLLKTEFPFVQDVTVETWGGGATLYAAVEGLAEKIPVTLLSSGVTKLLCILLGIALNPRGVVLIDEIENGFYFDRLPSIWRLIVEFAKEYRAQVFVTTHSLECIEAACTVAKDQAGLFSLIRAVKTTGTSTLRQFGGMSLIDAVDENIEVR